MNINEFIFVFKISSQTTFSTQLGILIHMKSLNMILIL